MNEYKEGAKILVDRNLVGCLLKIVETYAEVMMTLGQDVTFVKLIIFEAERTGIKSFEVETKQEEKE